jgi:tetraacyldisaccharide 4'-kinase
VNEADFKALISGEKRGAFASLFRAGLRCLSLGYAGGTAFRNRLFDAGWKKMHPAYVPVVSVGNITTGGTGKTPMVALLANWFHEKGVKPAILSRGYRAAAGGANDEKLVLDQLCRGIVHLQNPNRVASAQEAVNEHQAQVLILDDGFQHRRLARDLDLVLIDATCPWGYGNLLPRGLLREPLSGLKRADLAIITRADQVPEAELAQIRQVIEKHHPGLEGALAAFAPKRLVNAEGQTAMFDEFRGQPIAAFCGIGNPQGFRQTLQDCGWSLEDSRFRTFPDHHHYTETDFTEIGKLAQQEKASAILTTQKDLVKIPRTELDGLALWAVEIGVEWLSGEELLLRRLEGLLEDQPR